MLLGGVEMEQAVLDKIGAKEGENILDIKVSLATSKKVSR